MIERAWRDVADIVGAHYEAVDFQHRAGKDDPRFALTAGDWANPIAIGEIDVAKARQIATPPASEYVFAYPLDEEIGYFVVELTQDAVSVERIDFDGLLLKRALS